MAEAVIWAEDYLRKYLGNPESQDSVTLEEFSSGLFDLDGDYRKRLESRKEVYQDSWYLCNESRLRNYILPRFGSFLIDAISDVAIEDWIIMIPGVSDNTKNKILYTFRRVLHEAKRRGYVKENAAKEVQAISEDHKVRAPFTPDEIKILFPKEDICLYSVWHSWKWAAYFLILRDTGFRPGEAAAIKTDDIIFELSGVYVTRSVDYRTHQVKESIKTSKVGQPFKIGVLSPQALRILARLSPDDDGHIFRVGRTGFIYAELANKHLRAVCKAVGIDIGDRTQYAFRHSFETDVAGKVDNSILLQAMGHTRFRNEYDHRTPETRIKQIQPLKEIIDKR